MRMEPFRNQQEDLHQKCNLLYNEYNLLMHTKHQVPLFMWAYQYQLHLGATCHSKSLKYLVKIGSHIHAAMKSLQIQCKPTA